MTGVLRIGLFAHGTLWTVDFDGDLPPRCEARIATTFVELGKESIAQLTAAMEDPDHDRVRRRLETGRRCFALLVDGDVAAYGWVSYGTEWVNELDRALTFAPEEAYIWDCRTRPELRGQRCYSALLSACIYRLHEEGTPRVWIGSDLDNRPSIKGFANAGFRHVVNLALYHWGRITLLYAQSAPEALPHLVRTARQAATAPYEREIGPVSIGYKR